MDKWEAADKKNAGKSGISETVSQKDKRRKRNSNLDESELQSVLRAIQEGDEAERNFERKERKKDCLQRKEELKLVLDAVVKIVKKE